MLDTGDAKTMADIAEIENVRLSYVGRIIDLNLLAPDITDAILDGRQPPGFSLRELRKGIPLEWGEQRERFGF